ncbi:hypothetical protein OH687_19970 [Burkholderia anthina]|nr:hypothetical protein OH687_19970 [Burkholderia anthina]
MRQRSPPTASGCGKFMKEYGGLSRSDPVRAEKARGRRRARAHGRT